ncbi:transposase [Pseudomonas aeruginosa]|uniref:transposase n=1 Tax=Pseudomonas aeruginosa TaxID=287 RepID=UPI000EB60703
MRQRSSYPEPFKVQVVQECLQPGATVSSVAIRHGINANVIGVVRRNPRNFRQPSSSPATSASRSMNLPSVWKV